MSLKKLFNKKKEGDFPNLLDDLKSIDKDFQKERTREIQERHDAAAAIGKLPAPDIVADYNCECGSKNQFHIKNMNLEYGLNAKCVHCGAVYHVPPTILDHTEYWEGWGGASLVSNWRNQLKFTEHGIHTSVIDSKKSEKSQSQKQKDNSISPFTTWKTIKLGGYDNPEAIVKAMKKAKIKFSENIIDGLSLIVLSKEEREVSLIVASLEELGFNENTRCDEVFKHIKRLGYELCPPEVGPQLRLQYSKQEKGEESLLIANYPYRDRDGDSWVYLVSVNRRGRRQLTVSPFKWHENPGFVQYEGMKVVFLSN